jgi:sugar phosphate isomerase/epimerase
MTFWRKTRRNFLSDSAVIFGGALLSPAGSLARGGAASGMASLDRNAEEIPGAAAAGVDTGPHIAFPPLPRERLAVASYPFRNFITPGEAQEKSAAAPAAQAAKMQLKDFAAHVVEKFKIHRIEPWSVHFVSQEPRYLAEMRAAFEEAEVSVVNIAVDGQHSIYAADATERESAIAESKSWIDVAVAIGSPSVRTHVAEAKDSGPDLARAAESLRRVADYGAQKNIVVNLENDNPVTEDAFFIAKLAATVHSPWLHALPDFANSLVAMPARQAYDAIEAMFSQAYNICHVKAMEVNNNGEKFSVDMKRTFAILKQRNYKGFCSMEFDSPGDPYAGTADLIKQTLQNLS